MDRPKVCCSGCIHCLDCLPPNYMHARVQGIGPGTCSECTQYNGAEYHSSKHCTPGGYSGCTWARLGVTPVQYCGRLFNVWWQLDEAPNEGHRLKFCMEFTNGQLWFWQDFPKDQPPDCFNREYILPLQYNGVEPGFCDFTGATARVWGSNEPDK